MRHLGDLGRPILVDFGVVALVVAVELPLAIARPEAWPDVGALTPVLAVAAAAALLARRRQPVLVALGLGVAVAAAPVAMVPLFVALYGLGAYARRSAAVAVWALVAAETFALQVTDDGADGLVRAPVIALALGFPVALGIALDGHRRLMAELVHRAERAEREQQLLTDAAVATERARLARELHDVVAHRVSLMVLHASALELAPLTSTPPASADDAATSPAAGTAYERDHRTSDTAVVTAAPPLAPDDEPAAAPRSQVAEAALIGALGRHALDELREMLDVLRDGAEAAPLAPLPGIAEVHDLAAASRTAGVTVTVTEAGDVRSVPGSVARTAFRIVQEALTNVHKHATGAAVDVRLNRTGSGLEVEVVNRRPGRGPLGVPGGGHGLAGLRERVALVGGHVAAGPTSDGGWAVQAELPAP